jgi:protein-L-isoaspartate(D-aspartate) O-methyltransferase
MVDDYIVREGIKNPLVIKAMRTVERHQFVAPPSREQAYFDQAIAIGHKQTISPPFIVAYMTEALDPQSTDRVLEIGTGSGYQAAVLSVLVKDVYTIEIVEPLGKHAAEVLKKQRHSNVHCRIGDGYKGWPEHAPFDKIIVTCSPEDVPQPLIDQLKEGGRMIIPLGERYEQVFYLFEKQQGKLVKTRLLPALFVPMTGDAEENRKVLPDPTHPEVHNGGFEVDTEGDGRPVGWHYQRQLTLEWDGAPEGKAYVRLSNREPGRAAMLLQGMGLDGRAVAKIEVSLKVRADNVRNGGGLNESAALNVQFFDAERNPIGIEMIGPWKGSFGWTTKSEVIRVPMRAREAILRIGLNGATGELSVDDVRLTPQLKANPK